MTRGRGERREARGSTAEAGGPTEGAIVTLALEDETDVFAARQLARAFGVAVGLDGLDAVRLATALSELSRDVVLVGGGTVAFSLEAPDRICVDIVVPADGASRPRTPKEGWDASLAAAARLLDEVDTDVDPEGRFSVRMSKRLNGRVDLTEERRAALRGQLRQLAPRTPGEELRMQNRELVVALDEVRRQKADLEVANRELEETNRGVLALYDELSAELERTNKGVVALYAEIDDKNRQLREASEAKSRFLRSVSHELRTPGNSILGLTRLLLDAGSGDPLTPEQREQIGYIRTSAEDLLRLVNALLDLAKAESGNIDATVEDVSLPELFAELQGTTAPVLRPGVAMVTSLDDEAVSIRTDRQLLRHVVRNLLSNAAKFTESGRVELAAFRDGQDVAIEVRDTGVGMSEEDQSRVFEEFYQARTPLHATVRGTGLGLPLAQRVAKVLGGTLTLRSELGKGSVFRIALAPEGPDLRGMPDAAATGGTDKEVTTR